MFNFKAFVLMISMSATWAAQAAISLDRTRIIYGEGEKSISLVITNENNQLPYLAQSWIEDDKHEKSLPTFGRHSPRTAPGGRYEKPVTIDGDTGYIKSS